VEVRPLEDKNYALSPGFELSPGGLRDVGRVVGSSAVVAHHPVVAGVLLLWPLSEVPESFEPLEELECLEPSELVRFSAVLTWTRIVQPRCTELCRPHRPRGTGAGHCRRGSRPSRFGSGQ
jgi:hypothetical protein